MNISLNKVSIPGAGYIELMYSMGNDITIVNAARISFWKETQELDIKDENLVKFLLDHGHNSPLRHVQFQFRVECPEFVSRQWFKHVVGIAYAANGGSLTSEFYCDTPWNEVSGRYVELTEKFWKPKQFRKQSTTNKQVGSGDLGYSENQVALQIHESSTNASYASYKALLNMGVCREQARSLLPVGFITSFIMTTSLAAALHFIKLRSHEGAQKEIADYAEAMLYLIKPICPVVCREVLNRA